MGEGLTASCECGFSQLVCVGGGKTNHMTFCTFPCFCGRCHRIVQVNLLEKVLECPECQGTNVTPYDDPRLSESAGQSVVTSWNMKEELGKALVLTDAKYKCPKCGKMSLAFRLTMVWD